jgi:hypothetical protein
MIDEQLRTILTEIKGLRELVERALPREASPAAVEEKRSKRKALPPSLDFVTIREVAAYACVSEAAVSRGTRRRTWPFKFLRRVEVGGRVLFTRASFSHMGRVMRAAAEASPDDDVSAKGRYGKGARD